MDALLISIVVLLFTAQSFLCRLYTERYPGKPDMASPVFTVVSGFTIALISFILAGFSFSAQWETVLLGIGNAAVLFGYNCFLIRSSQRGSYAIMMVFSIAGGIVIPAITAAGFFGDDITIPQIFSILAIFVAVYLINLKASDGQKNKKGFLLSCFGLAICNGLYGTFLDAQVRLTGEEESAELLILTFGCAALISLLPILFVQRKDSLRVFRQNTGSALFLLSCSLVAAAAANMLLYGLSRIENTILLYTFDNSGVLLLSVLLSCLFFKEKLSRLNVVGCALMCAALVCFSLF